MILFYLLAELDGGGELNEADVVFLLGSVVVGVNGDLGYLVYRLRLIILEEVVFTDNDPEVTGVLVGAAVGSADDGRLVVDGAATEVEAEGVLEGNLVRDRVGFHDGAADNLVVVLNGLGCPEKN